MHNTGRKRNYNEFNNQSHHGGYNNNHHHHNNRRHNNNYHNNNHHRHHHNDNHDMEEPAAKRQRLTNLENNNNASLLSSISAPSMDQKMIAEHYGNRMDGELKDRNKSSIIQLRKINNWIKSVLISQFCHQKSIVLDIGAGKGGDLNKWNFQRISELVHVDHAIGSIQDCQTRYNEGVQKNKFNFKLTLICADAFGRLLSDSFDQNLYFDIVSSQFALHYAFETEERVNAMLKNVTER